MGETIEFSFKITTVYEKETLYICHTRVCLLNNVAGVQYEFSKNNTFKMLAQYMNFKK